MFRWYLNQDNVSMVFESRQCFDVIVIVIVIVIRL